MNTGLLPLGRRTDRTATALQRAWLVLVVVVLGGLLSACATGPKLVPHAFSFDGRKDGWHENVDLLAYSYGDRYHMVRNSLDSPRSQVFPGRTALPSGTGVNGPMPVGEFLHVKWRIKDTGEVLEDRVDLRGRLPKDMSDHELTFVIDGQQLYVYIMTPREQVTAVRHRTHKTWLSRYNVVYEIYPTLEPREVR